MIRQGITVGHAPRKISAACSLFPCRGGTINCTDVSFANVLVPRARVNILDKSSTEFNLRLAWQTAEPPIVIICQFFSQYTITKRNHHYCTLKKNKASRGNVSKAHRNQYLHQTGQTILRWKPYTLAMRASPSLSQSGRGSGHVTQSSCDCGMQFHPDVYI